jgi:hypothetical protein
MKLIILSAFVLAMTGCGKKEWSKEYASGLCAKQLKKQNSTKDLLNDDQMTKICDCIGDKMVSKYKTEAEANKDTEGVTEISKNCTIDELQK